MYFVSVVHPTNTRALFEYSRSFVSMVLRALVVPPAARILLTSVRCTPIAMATRESLGPRPVLLCRGSFAKARCTKATRRRLSSSGLVMPISRQTSMSGSRAALKAFAML